MKIGQVYYYRTGLLLPAKSMTNVFSSKDEYCT